MTSIFYGFLAAGWLLSLGFSIVSLFLHWKRRQEHPDVAELRERLSALQNEQIDLQDRVGQWMKRDNVRRARQGKQDKAQGDEEHLHQGPISKAELRRQVAQLSSLPGGKS